MNPIWISLPFLAVLILIIPFPTFGSKPTERFYQVEAGRFAYSPAVVRANPGDRVTIELVSTDVVHGLEIDGYGLDITADPGQPATMTFLADRSGNSGCAVLSLERCIHSDRCCRLAECVVARPAGFGVVALLKA
jgi:hypothetical protein